MRLLVLRQVRCNGSRRCATNAVTPRIRLRIITGSPCLSAAKKAAPTSPGKSGWPRRASIFVAGVSIRGWNWRGGDGGTWPRGDTYGDLLIAAGKRGVKVRLLVWYDWGAVNTKNPCNMPGHTHGTRPWCQTDIDILDHCLARGGRSRAESAKAPDPICAAPEAIHQPPRR